MTPRQQERRFEKRYSLVLLSIAEGDYRTAKAMTTLAQIRLENVFYIAQQAIEKSLKAVLVAKELPVPLIHDLAGLIGKLPAGLEPPYGYELSELNQYATIRRYEEGAWIPTSEDLSMVLEKTKAMLDWASAIVKSAVPG